MTMPLVLVQVAPGFRLAAAPAASYARMREAGCPAGITSAYRSLAEQQALRAAYLNGTGAFALPPGQSRHELGEALDLPRAAAAWVRAHPDHGWRFTNPAEWWHCEYRLDLDRRVETVAAPVATVPTAPASPDPAAPPIPLDPQEDDMLALIIWCYEHLVGRTPATDEVLSVLREQAGRSGTDVAAWFLAARADAPAVHAAYRDYLGRDADTVGLATWTGQTIAQVRAGVAGSPEAIARRG